MYLFTTDIMYVHVHVHAHVHSRTVAVVESITHCVCIYIMYSDQCTEDHCLIYYPTLHGYNQGETMPCMCLCFPVCLSVCLSKSNLMD